MAKFEKDPNWVEEVYKIEKTDPVVATVPNKSLGQIVQRTDYLKQTIENNQNSGNEQHASLLEKIEQLDARKQNNITTSSSVSSSSTTTVADSKSVKTAYDKAVNAYNLANTKISTSHISHATNSSSKTDVASAYALKQAFDKASNSNDKFVELRNMLIGIPYPYPLSTVPPNHLAMNGQRFNTRTYPELAKKYPSGKLPDMRGLVIRGWDNGRGFDVGRQLLSYQSPYVGSHYHFLPTSTSGSDSEESNIYAVINSIGSREKTGAGVWIANTARDFTGNNEFISSGIRARTYTNNHLESTNVENRVRNLAWNYVCLAR